MALIKVKTRGTDSVVGTGKNIIINGAMRVAQRGTSAASISSNGYFSTDRMKFYESSSGVFTVEQASDAPSGSGFEYSHKVTATTPDTSTAPTDLIVPLHYIVEKKDVHTRLAYGTSSAKPITMSFWIKSNVTGTYTISAYRAAAPARVQAQTYTISSANTWEFKTLTFLGDTTEAIDVNLDFYFNGLVGGGYSAASTTSGWATYTTTNWAGGHTATLFDTANDTWQITGLQLEVGDTATDFEHRSFGEDLALCQRYFYMFESKAFDMHLDYDADSATSEYLQGGISFPVEMRSTPSSSGNGVALTKSNLESGGPNQMTVMSRNHASFVARSASTGRMYLYTNSGYKNSFSAEL
jgi:hypothetical protein